MCAPFLEVYRKIENVDPDAIVVPRASRFVLASDLSHLGSIVMTTAVGAGY
jgi:hypothetical protein